MRLFFIIFILIYLSMHGVVFWGIHPLLKGHSALPTLTWLWMGAMVLTPLSIRFLEREGWQLTARALAWVGFSWMGLIFLAFVAFALLGCWELLIRLARWGFPSWPCLSLHGAVSAALVMAVVVAAVFYGFHEATDLRVERIRIASAKIPPGSRTLTIAQVSDLHLGLIHREEALAPITARLKELAPDMVVATGDIVDAQISHLDGLSSLWLDIDPPLGKFAVTGNHEYYAGLSQALDFFQRSGFVVLHNRVQIVTELLAVAGLDDPVGRPSIDERMIAETPLNGRFTILLKHRPRFNEKAAGLFDLQLSGHAHRGQMFPFNFFTALEYPMQDGLYELPGGAFLYASRGTGTWGPPMRIASPPEITLFEIVPAGP
ncbi:MAG: metallophosphoesterase [Deltaproteobacteria bacterium]|nr:metallophosphoesterase [Deltaproteobacteria bacterium]